LNTGGASYDIGDLRGRFLLLDFWTFCCVNCLHVLDELRPLEEKYADELVVVGVHSPKFTHEADPAALAAAVDRYAVHHPVLDDPELVTWQAYAARAWPTLVLVDPEGYVVAQYAGEGHVHAIDALLGGLVAEHRERGTLQPAGSPYVPPEATSGDLRFPAKGVRLPDGGLLVADTGHDRLVELDPDGTTLRRVLGDGAFREPNGLCLLPEDVAAEVGYDVVVADTVGHRLHGVELATGTSRVLAGNGRPWVHGDDLGGASGALSSPWDVAWWRDRVWVAMAGIHQLWTFDPRTGAVEVTAGTGNEGLVDGPLDQAWFAQTSGLAAEPMTGSPGRSDRLWIVDSETSSLRVVAPGPEGLEVRTAVGEGLFDFGFHDGDRSEARLQHPLGVLAAPDGSVLVADTYNGAVRRFDPDTGQLGTVATGLAEPSGLLADDDGLVLVVESAAHRISAVRTDQGDRVEGPVSRTRRPATDVRPGTLTLEVTFRPPPGQKVDDRFGPATQLHVSATPAALLREGDGVEVDLSRRLVLDPRVGEGVLHVAARAASCDIGEGEGAACRMHQQDWGIPVRVSDEGTDRLVLPLGG
jgi:thiol-disulfide isomerase/thioredoxin